MRGFKALAGVAHAAIAAAAATAAAQGTVSQDSASGDDGLTIQDIVVTATKRSSGLQTVPLAVSALRPEMLEKTGADEFKDILHAAPSMSFVPLGPLQQKVVMRGISAGTSRDAQTAASGFYLDDVPMSSSFTSSGTDLRLFDVSRVEVLRGPQGTLYGGGAMGGTIKVVTNQPDAEKLEGRIEGGGYLVHGGGSGGELNAMINAPLVPGKMAARLVGVYRHNKGSFNNVFLHDDDVDGYEIQGIRGAIKLQATENLSFNLMGLYQKSSYNGVAAIDTDLNKKPLYGDLNQVRKLAEPSVAKTGIINFVAEYDMQWAKISSSTSYLDNSTVSSLDYTSNVGVLLPGAPIYSFHLPNSEKAYIEEVRLTSAQSEHFNWIMGGFYQDDDLVVYRQDRVDPASALGQAGVIPLDYYTRTKRKIFAAFGEATYIFSPSFEVTGGLRYTSVKNGYTNNIYGLLLGIASPASAIHNTTSATSKHLSPKVVITYKPTTDHMLYISAAEGFRPGGPNAALPPDRVTGALTPTSYKSDALWNYEVGAKTSWLDRRLTFNVAAFYIKWKDIQVVETRTDRIPYLGNAGRAISQGVEVEINARPSENWLFGLSGGYTDSHFTSSAPLLSVRKGDRIAAVPRVSGTFNADYSRDIAENLKGYANFSLNYSSGATMGYDAKSRGISTSPYLVGNLRVGARFSSGFEATVYVNNLWDKRAETYIDTFDSPRDLRVHVMQPRTVGMKFGFGF